MGVIRLLIYKIFKLEDFPCESCETLKSQLEIANFERRQLLETIISFTKPAVEVSLEQREIAPIRPRTVPWRVRQQELEKNDRLTAEINKKQREDIAKLEKELDVEEKKETNAS